MKRNELTKLKLSVVEGWKVKIKKHKIAVLARKAGVSREAIYKIMNGECLPRITTMNKINAVLDNTDQTHQNDTIAPK